VALDQARISGLQTFETNRTIWDYTTADDAEAVSDVGYFGVMGAMMKPGDLIIATVSILTDPEYRQGFVITNDNVGHVQVAWIFAVKTSDLPSPA
jgi:hypothetical protein